MARGVVPCNALDNLDGLSSQLGLMALDLLERDSKGELRAGSCARGAVVGSVPRPQRQDGRPVAELDPAGTFRSDR